ncbi:acyl-CoA dehydrogenase family protein [Schinkia azotoformans]|uniref:acyl-CoA dehydrogenase family protein n=1 Tax=Schinkia azotoformans TaxID=1454 RepID=UPI002DB6A0F5|nr:acyl-CoA dehydrogenase family protein [Schinkia azotoformans]MEC1716971.1 acyl-CoA/acyl-ACP dehydrogenase [Schinkia azotoformans]MEC1743254.1 acyl-CoA/acyl-ACP dehydrogenase [Schinkia azotoformans]MEC1757011.1 acyl-CoA/acyl-ACP dehydrogenase [Schinkia azotoformans]MEC1767034.1 acyl-CoA/acyl-ACP dehydrogenase [Schinkia azotoformans]MEC1786700.1 acyl-CoA/acyl-ACP dehydrogenase [Schinkia azotoformans]
MRFQDLKSMDERLAYMKELSQRFLTRAAKVDEEGSFPFENISELKNSGYTELTLPKKYGGEGISLYDLIRFQEYIARGDGATALSIGWHMGIIQDLGEKNIWKESTFQMLCEEVKKGALINNCASEPQTGSPTRGGKPTTTAIKDGDKWIINGRKTFSTMAPVLDYFNVTATVQESGAIGYFLIPRATAGVEIVKTWDSIAMKGTGSHDLVLNDVKVEEDYQVEWFEPGNKGASGWLLHIPACYLGIAQAAEEYAINFAKDYSPNSITGSIIDLPYVKQKVGEMELELMRARHFLYSVAKQWDDSSENERNQLKPELGAVKLAVTNAAIKVVDLAMRVVGAQSLSAKNPLQRYYRDVRAGLHNPPMDDMTILLLAEKAISQN